MAQCFKTLGLIESIPIPLVSSRDCNNSTISLTVKSKVVKLGEDDEVISEIEGKCDAVAQ